MDFFVVAVVVGIFVVLAVHEYETSKRPVFESLTNIKMIPYVNSLI